MYSNPSDHSLPLWCYKIHPIQLYYSLFMCVLGGSIYLVQIGDALGSLGSCSEWMPSFGPCLKTLTSRQCYWCLQDTIQFDHTIVQEAYRCKPNHKQNCRKPGKLLTQQEKYLSAMPSFWIGWLGLFMSDFRFNFLMWAQVNSKILARDVPFFR